MWDSRPWICTLSLLEMISFLGLHSLMEGVKFGQFIGGKMSRWFLIVWSWRMSHRWLVLFHYVCFIKVWLVVTCYGLMWIIMFLQPIWWLWRWLATWSIGIGVVVCWLAPLSPPPPQFIFASCSLGCYESIYWLSYDDVIPHMSVIICGCLCGCNISGWG